MSPALLVIVVAAGIAAVVLSVHFTGGSARAIIADDAAARERFRQDFPDLAVRSVHLVRDRDAAFLALEDGRIGVVYAVGGRFLTRVVGAGDLVGTPRARDGSLPVRLRDFTWPGGVFAFADAEEAQAVEALVLGMRRTRLWDAG